MVEPCSSSSTKQTVGWILLSGCAAMGLHYLRQRQMKVEDRNKEDGFDDASLLLNVSDSIQHANAVANGISRLEKLCSGDYVHIRSKASVYEHQVAGHTDEILLTYQDMLLKPMIKERNFLKEVQFYEYVKSLGSHSSQSPAAFLPGYYGVLALHNEPSNSHVHRSEGDGCSDIFKTSNICVNGSEGKMSMYYIVLENVTKKFRRPCVLDLKIGRQTFEPTAPEEKKKRNISKYVHQEKLGFRITGFKNYNCLTDMYMIKGKAFGRSLQPDQVSSGFEKFFHDGRGVRKEVVRVVLQKLEKLWRWARKQNTFHLYCSSILVAYDGLKFEDDSHNYPDPLVDVRIIDFAHTICDDNNTNDEGYVYGLQSVIKHLQEILTK